MVRNGALEVNGKRFDLPFAGAFEVTRTSVNGCSGTVDIQDTRPGSRSTSSGSANDRQRLKSQRRSA